MDKTLFSSHKIEDRSHLSFIKREIHTRVAQAGFSATRAAEIDIIVAELTSNLIKHAGAGELLFRVSKAGAVPVLELLSLDNGNGISNLHQMMRDGASTTKTLGQGLGAMQRLSDFFQVYTQPKWGTVTYVRVGAPLPEAYKGMSVRYFSLAKEGETLCGDGGHIKQTKDGIQVLLGDGLGHGAFAHAAVQAAIESFRLCPQREPAEVLRCMHKDVRKTRGLVASVAALDFKTMNWHVCGVGNILTRFYQGILVKSCLSYNGIIGLNIPNTLNDHLLPSEPNQYLIMCSDGLSSRWDLSKYPALYKCDPLVWAAVIYKDFSRRNDDASILLGKVII